MLRDAPVLQAESAWLKANPAAPAGKSELVGRDGTVTVAASFAVMHFPDLLRIERDEPGSSRHYVVHTGKPDILLELTPDPGAPDRVGRGVMKRLCVPNSWVGDYQKYVRWMGVAQRFFAASFGPAESKSLVRQPRS